jgi:arginyl-tRNA synthetase
MEKNFKRTLVTSALPYANGPVHIGHLAGVYVPADIYVRYLRLKGRDVLFIGGSDEHGVSVTIRARKEGITVQEVVDRYHYLIKESFEKFGISFDIYSRTTSKTHHKLASDFFRKLYDDGKFVEQVSEQFYDEQTGHFLVRFRPAHAAVAQALADAVAQGAARVEGIRRRLEDHLHLAISLAQSFSAQAGDVLAVEQDAALGRIKQAGDHVDHRGLAAAALADQAQALTGIELKADVVHGREIRLPLAGEDFGEIFNF